MSDENRWIKNIWKRTAWAMVLGAVLPIAAEAQYVRIAPPPPVVERPYAAPGRGYTWVPGYQRWDGRRYIWTGGRWALPPRPRAVWVPGRWDRRPGGWYWVGGHWRG